MNYCIIIKILGGILLVWYWIYETRIAERYPEKIDEYKSALSILQGIQMQKEIVNLLPSAGKEKIPILNRVQQSISSALSYYETLMNIFDIYPRDISEIENIRKELVFDFSQYIEKIKVQTENTYLLDEKLLQEIQSKWQTTLKRINDYYTSLFRDKQTNIEVLNTEPRLKELEARKRNSRVKATILFIAGNIALWFS